MGPVGAGDEPVALGGFEQVVLAAGGKLLMDVVAEDHAGLF